MDLTIGSRSAVTGLTCVEGHLDGLTVAALRSVIDPLAAPGPSEGGVPDARPAALRPACALAEALQFILAHGSGDITDRVLPDHGGERPHITVTLEWDAIRGLAGTAVSDTGATLGVGQLRRLVCDAAVLPAVLDGPNTVLNLGRSARTFPPKLRPRPRAARPRLRVSRVRPATRLVRRPPHRMVGARPRSDQPGQRRSTLRPHHTPFTTRLSPH